MDVLGFVVAVVTIYAWDEPERFGHILGRIAFGFKMRDPVEVERKRRDRLNRRKDARDIRRGRSK